MTLVQFAVIPEEAFLDEHMTLGALRVLRLVWSMCLREGRITWSPFLTASQIGKAAKMRSNNLSKIVRELADRDYIIVGPKIIKGLYCLRPHQRFGETGPTQKEMGDLYAWAYHDARANSLPPEDEAGLGYKLVPPPFHRCNATADSESTHQEERGSSSNSLSRKVLCHPSTEGWQNSSDWTVTQQGILDLLGENGMGGAVPTQVTLMEGMTFRRVALLVADGIAKGQSTGLLLTRLRGKDIPPNVCPLCGAKKGFHYGFTDGDQGMNCPLSDDPGMTDEGLVAAWRRTRGMMVQPYWMGQEVED